MKPAVQIVRSHFSDNIFFNTVSAWYHIQRKIYHSSLSWMYNFLYGFYSWIVSMKCLQLWYPHCHYFCSQNHFEGVFTFALYSPPELVDWLFFFFIKVYIFHKGFVFRRLYCTWKVIVFVSCESFWIGSKNN